MSTVTAKSIERLAVGQVLNKGIDEVNPNLLLALQEFPWETDHDPAIDSLPEAELDLELNIRSCLGRIAHAGAFVGLHFPMTETCYAEVLVDAQAQATLAKVHHGSPRDLDDVKELLQAVLIYEMPHAVLVLDKVQFDPLWTISPVETNHPKVKTYPIWEAVASAVMVSKAWLEEVPERKLMLLEEAEKLCPGTALVVEDKIQTLVELGRTEEVIHLLKDLLVKRPTAKTLFDLYTLTRDKAYQGRLDEEYTRHMYYVLLQDRTEQYVTKSLSAKSGK